MGHVRFVGPFRTVFYVPQYVALGRGLFAREELVNTERAEAAIRAVRGPSGANEGSDATLVCADTIGATLGGSTESGMRRLRV